MNEPLPTELDRVTFQQVWRRVMPEDRPDCPFTLEAPALPTVTATPVPVVADQSPGLSRLAPAPAVSEPQPCLGEASTGELPSLEELYALTVLGQRAYQALARQSRRNSVFYSLASAKGMAAKQLSTAYFLISGREPTAPAPSAGPFPTPRAMGQALAQLVRSRFHTEQALATRLEGAANTTADPCLARLYRTLAGECRAQADQLRSWLETA